jgi:hypothetical protein
MYAFSGNDLVTAGGDKFFIKKVPSCNGVEHLAFSPAGHFLQQDRPSYMLPPPWICRIGFEALANEVFVDNFKSKHRMLFSAPGGT